MPKADVRRSRSTLMLSISMVSIVVLLIALGSVSPVGADHESSTRMTFEPVADSPLVNGTGEGMVEFHGGHEPDSRWTTTFQFANLDPDARYTVMVQGRYGEDGTDEATAFTELCSFQSTGNGTGGCWYYLVGLRRLGVVQLRADDANGSVVLQATKSGTGPGSMERTPNEFSLTLTATPHPEQAATPQR